MRGLIPFLCCMVASGQEFEVSSVKPNNGYSERAGMGLQSPGSFFAENVTVLHLIQEAWGANWSQRGAAAQKGPEVLGGPPWLRTDRFDVLAKWRPEAGADMHLMLRALLATRFGLQARLESRHLPVFVLTLPKGNLKLSLQKCEDGCGTSHFGREGSDWTLDGKGMTMNDLAGTLSLLVGTRPVIDRTGFTGTFDVHLRWTPGLGEPGETGGDARGPSVFTALREHLGLALKPGRGAVEVLVIDHVEKPRAN